MNERLDKALALLQEEWDVIVILTSRHGDGSTDAGRIIVGNGFAVQQMLEDSLDDYAFGSAESGGEELDA